MMSTFGLNLYDIEMDLEGYSKKPLNESMESRFRDLRQKRIINCRDVSHLRGGQNSRWLQKIMGPGAVKRRNMIITQMESLEEKFEKEFENNDAIHIETYHRPLALVVRCYSDPKTKTIGSRLLIRPLLYDNFYNCERSIAEVNAEYRGLEFIPLLLQKHNYYVDHDDLARKPSTIWQHEYGRIEYVPEDTYNEISDVIEEIGEESERVLASQKKILSGIYTPLKRSTTFPIYNFT